MIRPGVSLLLGAALFRASSALWLYPGGPLSLWSSDDVLPTATDVGAALSPDGDVLYVTTNDGTLTAVRADDGKKLWSYPESGGSGTSVSEVTFSEDGDMLVYSVAAGDGTSKIVGMAHRGNGAPMWEYDLGEGEVSGAPFFGTNATNVYFTYNDGTEGTFAILDVTSDSATLAYSQSLGDLMGSADWNNATVPDSMFYSPVGVALSPMEGNFRRGTGNNNDVVIWANLALNDVNAGFNGYVYAYQKSLEGVDEVFSLGAAQWSTWTRPVFGNGGMDLFFAGSRSFIRAWTGEQAFHRSASIKIQPERDGPLPVYSQPALSPDEQTYYVATTKNMLYAIDTATKTDQLKATSEILDGAIVSGPTVTPDGMHVAVVTTTGRAYMLDTNRLELKWASPALDKEPPAVDLTFVLSSTGHLMYTATPMGVAAWQIAAAPPTISPAPTLSLSEEPSASPIDPTASPTSAPTAAPTGAPTGTPPTPTATPTVTPTGEPTATRTGAPTEKPVEPIIILNDSDEPTASPVKTEASSAVRASGVFLAALAMGAASLLL